MRGGLGPRTSPTPASSLRLRPGGPGVAWTPLRARRHVTLRGLVSETIGRGRASWVPPLGDANWEKPRTSAAQSVWEVGGRIQPERARRGVQPESEMRGS